MDPAERDRPIWDTINESHAGTNTDPRPPGDWDNVCDVCCYGLGLGQIGDVKPEALRFDPKCVE